MTETAALLDQLTRRDVRVWIEEDRLGCSAPPGVLDDDLRAALSQRKAEVLAFLKRAQELESAPATVVPIKPEGQGTPLFVLSGHGGDVYYLLSLVRHLETGRPVLGVQPPGLDGSDPLTTVEALARYEIEQMRRRQPRGPYLLAGHCAGGTIAFEAARQLKAAGERVDMLMLIGSPYPSSFRPLWQRLHRVSLHVRAMVTGSLAERRHYIADKLRHRLTKAHGPGVPGEAAIPVERQRVEAATMAAVRAYQPQVYDGAVDLVVTADRWHRAQLWSRHAASVRLHRIERFEINELLLGPEVTRLADLLRQRLATLPI